MPDAGRVIYGTNEFTRPVRLNLLVSGCAAWLLTVAVPVLANGVSVGSRVSAVAALGMLILGIALTHRFARAGALITLWGFIAVCALTWLSLGELLNPARASGVRAALGAVAWVTFSLAWGAVRQREAVPENDPRVIPGDALEPRHDVQKITYVAFGVSVVAGLSPWLLSWRALESGHALLAHSVGLATAMWIISAGADTAVAVGHRRRMLPPGLRLQLASSALGVVTLLGLVGIAYWQLRNPR